MLSYQSFIIIYRDRVLEQEKKYADDPSVVIQCVERRRQPQFSDTMGLLTVRDTTIPDYSLNQFKANEQIRVAREQAENRW